ncbi:MAG: DEAD/DEAH box helicase [Acidobacteria bacterium]|nr:DEAD/DEAH box helicase [Acidobacteriota bacterium]MCW5949601.1 DEAD/DEAH box helicase [Pyrinomonadaceae bacterium]
MPRNRSGGKDRRDRRPKSRHFKERNDKRRLAGESSGVVERLSAEQVRDVERLLSGIGVPQPSDFVPDDFQIEALKAIDRSDVLVTAPTGSGKTWIAREEIRRLLAAGKRSWYTTPLKALTNTKYAEFCDEFGAESVGILTGDRKENTDAPLIVGTTEIYRNQLFDSLRDGTDVRADLVILDEAHYFSDEDRGHVWEESIILSPPRIRLLLLSATVGEAREFADWIGEVRGTTVRVVTAGPRPVELRAAFMSRELNIYPLYRSDGSYNSTIDRLVKQKKSGGTRRYRR